jgi:AraC-like DNA-binding protein
LRLAFDSNSGAAATRDGIEALVQAVGGKPRLNGIPDQRITDLLTHIQTALPRKVPLPDLARTVGLSADRLSHLFVDTVGTPLRTYIVWQRYKLALAQISQSAALTPLAYECGFSDAAHMTRVFVHFFGMAPSVVVRSGFVQDFAFSTVE